MVNKVIQIQTGQTEMCYIRTVHWSIPCRRRRRWCSLRRRSFRRWFRHDWPLGYVHSGQRLRWWMSTRSTGLFLGRRRWGRVQFSCTRVCDAPAHIIIINIIIIIRCNIL